MNRLRSLAAVGALLAMAGIPSVASAHVTLQPNEAPAGAFKRLDLRVPHERDDSATKKIQLKFPPGFIFVSYEPVVGWTAKVKKIPLDPPVEVFGQVHTEQFDTITFTAWGPGVRPLQFQDFGLAVGLPNRPGTTLTFEALQTYADGEVISWTGAPGSPRPAPTVKLLPASAPAPAAASSDRGSAAGPGPTADGGFGGYNGFGLLIMGGLAVLVVATLAVRHTRGTAPRRTRATV